jgi:hypothetical protein
MSEFVPTSAIDYAAIAERGGDTDGNQDFELFKCPSCGRVYLIDGEEDMIYSDAADLTRRVTEEHGGFDCLACGHRFAWAEGRAIIGPKASLEFRVTWSDLRGSGWAWLIRREAGR